MDLTFLDENFNQIMVVDVYTSLIWTDKYYEAGDFELINPPLTQEFLDGLQLSRFVSIKYSDRLMYIESKFVEDEEFKITGRGIETMLDRRVIRKHLKMTDQFKNIIGHMIQENVTFPTNSARTLPDFMYIPPTDPRIDAVEIAADYIGDTVYDVIVSLCTSNGIGWKIIRETSDYRLYFYMGIDRTTEQDENEQVTFSNNLDNLLSSSYVESTIPEKNVVIAAGEEGIGGVSDLYDVYLTEDEPSGYERKETYLETGVTRNTDGDPLTEEEYVFYIFIKGVEKLVDSVPLKSFDSDVDTEMYGVGKGFYLGDIVEVFDGFGNGGKSKVIGITFSNTIEGEKIFPIFQGE